MTRNTISDVLWVAAWLTGGYLLIYLLATIGG